MGKIEVPGGWLILRPVETITERARRPLVTQMAELVQIMPKDAEGNANLSALNAESVAGFSSFNDKLAVALITEWSFGSAVSEDALLDLPAPTYDAIRKIVSPYIGKLMPDFGPTPDADSPTEPSDG